MTFMAPGGRVVEFERQHLFEDWASLRMWSREVAGEKYVNEHLSQHEHGNSCTAVDVLGRETREV